MIAEKRALSFEDIEAQTALELPTRESPVTVIIGCLALCVGRIQIRDINVDVAAAVCAQVQVLNVVLGAQALSCTTRAR